MTITKTPWSRTIDAAPVFISVTDQEKGDSVGAGLTKEHSRSIAAGLLGIPVDDLPVTSDYDVIIKNGVGYVDGEEFCHTAAPCYISAIEAHIRNREELAAKYRAILKVVKAQAEAEEEKRATAREKWAHILYPAESGGYDRLTYERQCVVDRAVASDAD